MGFVVFRHIVFLRKGVCKDRGCLSGYFCLLVRGCLLERGCLEREGVERVRARVAHTHFWEYLKISVHVTCRAQKLAWGRFNSICSPVLTWQVPQVQRLPMVGSRLTQP